MRYIVFGHSSFIGQTFARVVRERGDKIITVSSRPHTGADLVVDLCAEKSIEQLDLQNAEPFDGVLFSQGINPSLGFENSHLGHFDRMYRVNIAGPAFAIRRLIPWVAPASCFLFLGSSAVRRGSYDPAYGSSKAALTGLVNSLARYVPTHRFNIISLGLVEGSPVSEGMPTERRRQHASEMFGRELVQSEGIARLALEIFTNRNINRADYLLDGGVWT